MGFNAIISPKERRGKLLPAVAAALSLLAVAPRADATRPMEGPRIAHSPTVRSQFGAREEGEKRSASSVEEISGGWWRLRGAWKEAEKKVDDLVNMKDAVVPKGMQPLTPESERNMQELVTKKEYDRHLEELGYGSDEPDKKENFAKIADLSVTIASLLDSLRPVAEEDMEKFRDALSRIREEELAELAARFEYLRTVPPEDMQDACYFLDLFDRLRYLEMLREK